MIDRLRDILRSPTRRWHAIALLGVALVFANALRIVFAPFFADTSLYGFRDWDAHSSYRYITVVSLLRYHEFPWWHPFLCGGFPAWAYAEGATNLVSPYLPLYLMLPVQLAERLEVVLSTLCALVFTYLLAGRLTKSAALRALVAVTYAVNGRWVLQISEGHTWHLQYAWLPLALFLFDVSLDAGKLKWAVYAGIVLATIAYMGGIYPLPHAALALVLYASALSIGHRSLRPMVALAITAVTGLGFAAPKLLPLADLMNRFPRRIDSPEAIGLGQLLSVFTEPTGTIVKDPPVTMPMYGWHEWGIYVGVWGTLAMVLAILGPSVSGKANALRASGILFILLGCGTFHPYAPWTLLHELPTFSSQHVPARFLMAAVLLLMLAFAGLAARLVDSAVAQRGWIDSLLLIPVFALAANIAAVGLRSSKEVFSFRGPTVQASAVFHHVEDLPYKYDPDWRQRGRQQLLAMYANTGVIRCYGIPKELVPGAIAEGTPGYRGEAYIVTPGAGTTAGTANIIEWSPNTARVEYEGAAPGSTLVYNMNYDPSWHANGAPAVAYRNAVAIPLTSSSGEVTFHYYPRTLGWGLLAAVLTALVAFRGERLLSLGRDRLRRLRLRL
ncbi:MAG: hypothetical protein ACLQVI_38795 [Polyangiaceae bacterium]